MGKDQSVILPKMARRFGDRGDAMWPALVIAAVCVLAVAVKVAVALTYAGPVTVTANMSPFSPNPVKVNSSATSSLSASYTPPSGVSEGDLSAQYDWSVQVQYKPLEADSFGSPPSGSYTDSISLPIHRDKLCCSFECDVDPYPADRGLLASICFLRRDGDGHQDQSILERQRKRRAGGIDELYAGYHIYWAGGWRPAFRVAGGKSGRNIERRAAIPAVLSVRSHCGIYRHVITRRLHGNAQLG